MSAHMQEAIDAMRVAPAWAQVGIALFVLAFLAMIIGPRLTQRRARKRFAALAQARGARVVPGSDVFTASFSVEQGGRRLTVRRELRSSAGGSSYRGPQGHLVVSETRLSGSRWKMHGVDIARRRALTWLSGATFQSGDAAFDARFRVRQDGVPVREGWLDGPTRAAVTTFFDLPSVAGAGAVWVQEGLLQYVNDTPNALDPARLTAILEQQAALAAVLERTAGGRGPTT